MPKSNEFKKFNTGKIQPALIEASFLIKLAEVLTHGAQKYDKDNWKKGDAETYKNALMRHILSYLEGEVLDEDSGLEHTAHIAANIMFLQHFDKENDI